MRPFPSHTSERLGSVPHPTSTPACALLITTLTAASASASSPAGSSGSAGSDSKPKLEDVKPKTEDNDVKAQSPPTRPPLSTIDSDRKESRTAKKDGIADKLRAEPNDGDDFRHKIVVQFYDALASDSTAEKKILTERAQGIERQVWEKANGSTGNDYRQSESRGGARLEHDSAAPTTGAETRLAGEHC